MHSQSHLCKLKTQKWTRKYINNGYIYERDLSENKKETQPNKQTNKMLRASVGHELTMELYNS